MPRLRRVDCAGPGIARVKRGRGFSYRAPDGGTVTDPQVLQRIADLVIPPAWTDVWICPHPRGHIQAVGTDAAGRRQYRYHDEWRVQRDAEKHERVLLFARRLPAARVLVAEHLAQRGMTKQRVLAAAFRLLDLGFFRIGGETYAEANGSFGLATMRRRHVKITGDLVVFDYTAKSGKHRVQGIVDDNVRKVVKALLDRDDTSKELLAFKDRQGWHDITSADINAYLREVLGREVSAKDFRTWHATVLMAVGLAVSTRAPTSETARKRAVSRVVTEVSHYLGNTPAVCRSSYIDPRVIDLYDDGTTIAPSLERLGAGADFGQPATHGQIEAAVLRLLRRPATATRRRRPTSPAAPRQKAA
ncbi:MAG: DNA topoisomerase IB [Sporichthyaceae bacterium]